VSLYQAKGIFLPVHDGWKALYWTRPGKPGETLTDGEGNTRLFGSEQEALDAVKAENGDINAKA
jgi:hypothetical protein